MDCVGMDVGACHSYVVTVVCTLAATIMILVVDKISIKHAVCSHMTSPVRSFIHFNFMNTSIHV